MHQKWHYMFRMCWRMRRTHWKLPVQRWVVCFHVLVLQLDVLRRSHTIANVCAHVAARAHQSANCGANADTNACADAIAHRASNARSIERAMSFFIGHGWARWHLLRHSKLRSTGHAGPFFHRAAWR